MFSLKDCRLVLLLKKLLIVTGAIHGKSYDVEQEKYEEATRKFWDRYE